MLDREFTFSDNNIIQTLQTQFIPAVGNTHELQNQKFETSKWFMGMASKVNQRVNQGVTAQGFYIAGADGKGYGFNNNRDPERVRSFLAKGMDSYRADPPAHVEIPPELLNAKFTRGPDPSVSVMRVFSRIYPLPAKCDALNHGVGRDSLWIYPEEVQALAKDAAMPESLVRRIVRFHLVDNVRGEPDMWSPSQIREASFKVRKLKPNTFAFTGTYLMEAGAHGLKGTMEGEIVVDAAAQKVTKMKAYGEAKAWGAGTYTPRPPEGQFPLVFAIVKVDDLTSKVTPPAAALYGDGEYRRPK